MLGVEATARSEKKIRNVNDFGCETRHDADSEHRASAAADGAETVPPPRSVDFSWEFSGGVCDDWNGF